MLSLSNLGKRSGGSRATSGDSLQRLKRQDLLELLLEQIGENEQLQAEAVGQQQTIADLNEQNERLKRQLNMKDAIIAGFLAQGHPLPEGFDPFDAIELLRMEQGALEVFFSIRDAAEREPEMAVEPELQAGNAIGEGGDER